MIHQLPPVYRAAYRAIINELRGTARKRMGTILQQTKRHIPFTFLGAVSGIVLMVVFRNLSYSTAYMAFYVLHPAHIALSALATASMYQLHTSSRHIHYRTLKTVAVGLFGSLIIATLSDSVFPYVGELLLQLKNPSLHIGFIEKWWLVNPLALIGSLLCFVKAATRIPHAGHVLLSTWAGLFHFFMAGIDFVTLSSYLLVSLFLFFGVWIPNTFNDIIFPLLVANRKER